MTIIKIIETFTFYGLDVIILSAATCAAVQILKVTLLKNCKKKIVTFLPFLIGTLVYAAYAAVCNQSAAYLLDHYTLILERGFGVGTLSTVIYVWYEQFIREKSGASATESVIATLIEGFVPSDAAESVAAAIAAAIEKDVTGDGAKKAAEILKENAEGDVTEKDIVLLSKLIIETLAHLNTV